MKIKSIFFALILTSTSLYAKQSIQEKAALESLKAIFPAFGKSQTVNTQGCAIQKEKWAALMLTKQSFTENLVFNKSCDLQGTHKVKMDEFFPINLEVKNLKNFKKIIGNLKFQIIFEEMPVLKMEVQNMILKGTEDLVFNMDYALIVDVMSEEPLKKHKGGTLYLKRHGKKVLNKKIPLKFK